MGTLIVPVFIAYQMSGIFKQKCFIICMQYLCQLFL